MLDLLDIEPDSPTPIVVEPKAEDKPKPVVTATPKVEPPKVKTYKTESDSGNPSMVKSEDPTPYVITSYSIHYTKLYERLPGLSTGDKRTGCH